MPSSRKKLLLSIRSESPRFEFCAALWQRSAAAGRGGVNTRRLSHAASTSSLPRRSACLRSRVNPGTGRASLSSGIGPETGRASMSLGIGPETGSASLSSGVGPETDRAASMLLRRLIGP